MDRDQIAQQTFGKNYDELNTAQKQLVDAKVRSASGSGTVLDGGKRPWRDVPDWELTAAYKSGNVVNGEKVTQSPLIAELKARGMSDADINAAIQPGTLTKNIQEGAKAAISNAVKANKALGGEGTKYSGPSEAEIKRLNKAKLITPEEADAYLVELYKDKDPRDRK